MTIWVLSICINSPHYDYEHWEVYGIYSTREKALEKLETSNIVNKFAYEISEYLIDV